jgi:hypothetical protein
VNPRRLLKRVLHTRTARVVRHRAGRVLAPLRRVQLIAMFRRDFTGPVPVPPVDLPVVFSPAGVDEVAEVADIDGHGEAREATFRSRLEEGQGVFVARLGDEIVGYNWAAFGHSRDGDERLVMADDEAYFYDGYTAVALRGYGLHPALHCWQIRYLRDRGIRTGYTAIVITTRRSMNMIKQLQWTRTGWMLALKGRGGRTVRFLRVRGTVYPSAGVVGRGTAESRGSSPFR